MKKDDTNDIHHKKIWKKNYIYKILKARISVNKLCSILMSSKIIFFQLFFNVAWSHTHWSSVGGHCDQWECMELVEGEMKSVALALAANFVRSSLISCISSLSLESSSPRPRSKETKLQRTKRQLLSLTTLLFHYVWLWQCSSQFILIILTAIIWLSVQGNVGGLALGLEQKASGWAGRSESLFLLTIYNHTEIISITHSTPKGVKKN